MYNNFKYFYELNLFDRPVEFTHLDEKKIKFLTGLIRVNSRGTFNNKKKCYLGGLK